MSGETDLQAMLASVQVERRQGTFAYVSLEVAPDPMPAAEAVITEAEGTTFIVAAAEAARRGWPVAMEVAWLTLRVHSALDAVGLTAAVAGALRDAGIPCNMIAGTYHDHIMVPVGLVEHAVRAIEALSDR